MTTHAVRTPAAFDSSIVLLNVCSLSSDKSLCLVDCLSPKLVSLVKLEVLLQSLVKACDV